MLELILLILILILAGGAFLNSWMTRMKVELLESGLGSRLDQRVKQLGVMQYNAMRRQGWTHEELSEAFPPIANLND